MSLWVCRDCTCAYSVGAARCPQCGGKRYAEQGSKNDPTLTRPDTADDTETGETDA